jgi:hypothetical protein
MTGVSIGFGALPFVYILISCSPYLEKTHLEGTPGFNIYASCDNRNGGSGSGGNGTVGGVISGSVSMINDFQQAYFNQQRLQAQTKTQGEKR